MRGRDAIRADDGFGGMLLVFLALKQARAAPIPERRRPGHRTITADRTNATSSSRGIYGVPLWLDQAEQIAVPTSIADRRIKRACYVR